MVPPESRANFPVLCIAIVVEAEPSFVNQRGGEISCGDTRQASRSEPPHTPAKRVMGVAVTYRGVPLGQGIGLCVLWIEERNRRRERDPGKVRKTEAETPFPVGGYADFPVRRCLWEGMRSGTSA